MKENGNMCLYPKIIFNKKYTENKKNGGIIPAVNDKRVMYVPVACGKCMECMKKKARDWQIRINEEVREDTEATFVTLTFNEESLKTLREIAKKEMNEMDEKTRKLKIEENEICRIAVRKFLERWRKKSKKSIKHWLVTELGHKNTERIHMHGIIWSKDAERIKKTWGYGWVYIGEYVNEKTVNYIVKYIHKMDVDHKGYEPKILTSSGIGKGYVNRWDSKRNKYKKKDTNEQYKYRNGLEAPLPIYYRNKIYTEEEREKLWIEKLDKNERWVNGSKVIVDNWKGWNGYQEMLLAAQALNRRLGYGDNTKEWKIEDYNERVKILRKSENQQDYETGLPFYENNKEL